MSPSPVPIHTANTSGSWSRGWGEEGNNVKNDRVWHEYRMATAHWWKHYTIFTSICSPQHTDGKWTGRKGEDRRAGTQTAGRLNTSLTVKVTLYREGISSPGDNFWMSWIQKRCFFYFLNWFRFNDLNKITKIAVQNRNAVLKHRILNLFRTKALWVCCTTVLKTYAGGVALLMLRQLSSNGRQEDNFQL